MKEKNKLQEDELKNVNGGYMVDDSDLILRFKNSSESLYKNTFENKVVGGGCKSSTEKKSSKNGNNNK